MGTKYTTVTVSGYNSSPPSDDAAQTDANKVKWSTQKTKLGDPLKTAIESINTALVTALDSSVRTATTTDTTVAGDHLKTIQCTATSVGFTLSLGDAATMAAGYIVTVVNSTASNANVTVGVITSTNRINNTTNGTKLLHPGDALTFVVASPAVGYNVIGRAGDNLQDALLRIVGSSDSTKKVAFEVDGLTAGATRTMTVPDRDLTLGPVLGTPQASTSGTSIDFTSIPSWARRITISFVGVSTNGTSQPLIQIGDSGGVETSGYLGSGATVSNAAATVVNNFTTGFGIQSGAATNVLHGHIVLTMENSSSFTWVCSHTIGWSSTLASSGGGSKSLSAALDRVRITTVGGTDTFDAGEINILYE